MKFQIAINLERMNEQTSMTAVRDHTLRMVKMADAAGFDIVWAAERKVYAKSGSSTGDVTRLSIIS